MICPNCKYPADGQNKFCPNCGQSNKTKILSFRALVRDFLDSIFNFDTKFFETLKVLVIAPGRITNHYLEGKRARYVSPGRLYIVASVIMFAMLGYSTQKSLQDVEWNSNNISFSTTTSDSISLNTNKIKKTDLTKIKEYSQTQLDSFFLANDIPVNAVTSVLTRQMAHVLTTPPIVLLQKSLKGISISMFFLMPIFALILALFYFRQKRFYVEHLIYSVHFHAISFLMVALIFGIIQIQIPDWVIIPMVVIPQLYLIITLKSVYKNGWVKSIVKFFLISFIYGFVQLFSMLITMVIAVLLF